MMPDHTIAASLHHALQRALTSCLMPGRKIAAAGGPVQGGPGSPGEGVPIHDNASFGIVLMENSSARIGFKETTAPIASPNTI
jgi:hypothetical protein